MLCKKYFLYQNIIFFPLELFKKKYPYSKLMQKITFRKKKSNFR